MKVFVTGATGYVGGTVARALVDAGHSVTGLVRGEERAAALREQGISPLVGTLDDLALLAGAARASDGVVSAAHADHSASVRALLAALAGSGKVFLHTSGAGIVADCAGGEASNTVYDEDTPVHPLPRRVDRVALNHLILDARAQGVRANVVAPPMVYGHGTGLHRDSMQIPMLMADARRHGHARHVGAGANRWSSVHVADLASLYLHIVQSPGGGDFYYAEGGEHSMGTIAQAVHQALGFAGLAVPITIDQATEAFGELMATYSFGSNCRVRALRARQKLGWAPAMPGLLAFLAGA